MNLKSLTAIFVIAIFFVPAGCKNLNESKKTVANQPAPGVSDSSGVALNISIHEAALNGESGQVMNLLKGGLDVNTTDKNGRTALMYAAFNGHTDIIEKLLIERASVNLRDTNGRTALMMASSGPYPAAVKMLLDHNADPNITDSEEHFTALMYAASEGQLDVVKILLSYRADPFLKDVDGDDALTFARNNGHTEVATLLQGLKR